ncbi:MAG: response regulator transcription factor [Clostridia bacterium]|nr:response regulator transcription factor [Clostridia bacterium]
MKKILIAEDEKSIREFITLNLRRHGFSVAEAENGTESLKIFEENKDSLDVVLLDVMMPKLDGIEACRRIRELSSTVGIIFLTAKTQEQDKVFGLYSGADDYITKPFSVTELLARIEAVYRRVKLNKEILNANSDEIICGKFRLSTKKRAVFCDGQRIDLSQIEFQILELFFSKPNRTISREELLNHVWGESYFGDDKVVDVNIRRLRLKIEKDPSCPDYLTTVWGKGYKWISGE